MESLKYSDARTLHLCARLADLAINPNGAWRRHSDAAEFLDCLSELAAHLDFNAVGLSDLLMEDMDALFEELVQYEFIDAPLQSVVRPPFE